MRSIARVECLPGRLGLLSDSFRLERFGRKVGISRDTEINLHHAAFVDDMLTLVESNVFYFPYLAYSASSLAYFTSIVEATFPC